MPTTHLLAFLAAAAVIVAVPGPSVLFTVGRALTVGRRAALLTVAGNSLGLLVQVVLVALGLGAVVATSATVYAVVKYVGAAYLIWLGIDAIRHRHESLEPPPGADRHTVETTWSALRTGALVGLTNPKSIVFFAALLPQFTDRGAAASPQPVQLLVLGAVFVVLALIGDSMWAIAAATVRGWFARSPRRIARLRGAGGVMICGLGAGVALTRTGP